MSPISLCLNLLLAGLLTLTLMLGWRLNRRLAALREGQLGFAKAVADLDRAAGRAEKGLADLRAATDEAVEFLSGRIEKGRELAVKLERLTTTAVTAAAAVEPAPAPIAASNTIAMLDRAWRRPEAASRPPVDPEAAAESLVLKLSEVLDGGRAVPPGQRFAPRSRAVVDDDLFEGPEPAAPLAFARGR